MADADKTRTFDYRGVPVDETLGRMRFIENDEGRRWRYRRVMFRVGLVLFFLPIALYFWPNLITFGKLTYGYTPADLVETVNRDCVPVVRAMKEYERDTGHLPDSEEDLIPRYLASKLPGNQFIGPGHYQYFAKGNQMIEYDFRPGSEGWTVSGPYGSGRIPVPPVTLAPRAHPPATAK